ncbi:MULTISPECIES: hypothetical protein [Psychrilyobacter]|uniref:Uncharacterized protein n=1 Tax=Psychrilyobacter piezotolerans TaxID=2293438 RepID=A0ABX9KFY5_9FUSO|nr:MULTISPECIES: hypothetical protein [Psychrilyobacter]NDI78480.1 hypothetical protein [Psychrilyobacter piezotolerans]RDE60665.1 hypothetical protein DV867_10560 [Psychrilyobacter sp. S5]REI40592.1 hypothetical protein DYH56_10560 [Psychrilyobacter piezotolerans]
MKKILLGLLIVGALSACTSSKEKDMEMSTKVDTLNETVTTQMQEYESLKAETEELKMQVEELKMMEVQE